MIVRYIKIKKNKDIVDISDFTEFENIGTNVAQSLLNIYNLTMETFAAIKSDFVLHACVVEDCSIACDAQKLHTKVQYEIFLLKIISFNSHIIESNQQGNYVSLFYEEYCKNNPIIKIGEICPTCECLQIFCECAKEKIISHGQSFVKQFCEELDIQPYSFSNRKFQLTADYIISKYQYLSENDNEQCISKIFDCFKCSVTHNRAVSDEICDIIMLFLRINWQEQLKLKFMEFINFVTELKPYKGSSWDRMLNIFSLYLSPDVWLKYTEYWLGDTNTALTAVLAKTPNLNETLIALLVDTEAANIKENEYVSDITWNNSIQQRLELQKELSPLAIQCCLQKYLSKKLIQKCADMPHCVWHNDLKTQEEIQAGIGMINQIAQHSPKVFMYTICTLTTPRNNELKGIIITLLKSLRIDVLKRMWDQIVLDPKEFLYFRNMPVGLGQSIRRLQISPPIVVVWLAEHLYIRSDSLDTGQFVSELIQVVKNLCDTQWAEKGGVIRNLCAVPDLIQEEKILNLLLDKCTMENKSLQKKYNFIVPNIVVVNI